MFQLFYIAIFDRPILLFSCLLVLIIVSWLLLKIFSARIMHGNEEADAIVLSMNETGLYINGQSQVKLQVQVQPEKGRSFVAEVNEIIPAAFMEKLSAGVKIKVRYSSGPHKQIVLLG